MKTIIIAAAIAGSALLLRADATLPTRIPVDVELPTLSGTPRTEVVTIVVSVYAHKDAADPLWFEEQTVKPNASGKLTVLAGATTEAGIPPQLFAADEARWIGVTVKGDPEQPRVMVVSVPYAVRARDAERIAGRTPADLLHSDEFKERIREVLVEERATTAPRDAGPLRAPVTSSGRPIAAPPRRNDILLPSAAGTFVNEVTSGTMAGAVGVANSNDAGTIDFGVTGVFGQVASIGPGDYSAGVRGVNSGSNDSSAGVIGYHSGSGSGVYGSSTSGTGVLGQTGLGYGVWGISADGSAVTATYNGPLPYGTALTLDNGAFRVTGTTRAAFTFTVTAGNQAAIDHPLCNDNPSAILFVTPVGGAVVLGGGAIPFPSDPNPVYVVYFESRWHILHLNDSSFAAGAEYNVLIINQ